MLLICSDCGAPAVTSQPFNTPLCQPCLERTITEVKASVKTLLGSTCRVTFRPALSRPDAEWETVILHGANQAAVLTRLQEIVAKCDQPFKQITLVWS